MLYKGEGFFDVEIFDFAVRRLVIRDRSHERINKNIEVADQMKRRLFFIVHNIEHLIAHDRLKFAVHGIIDRLIDIQARYFKGFLRPEAVKLQPAVFPGNTGIGDICGDLPWRDEKTLPGFQNRLMTVSFLIVPIKNTLSSENIVEQIVVPDRRPIRVGRVAVFFSELIQTEINEKNAGKHGEILCHMSVLSGCVKEVNEKLM